MSDNTSVSRRNTTIDIFRMIAAVMVVAMHSNIFSDCSRALYINIYYGLLRVAVPFFFVTAGYFYYKSISSGKKVGSYLLKIAIVFLAFTLIEGTIYLIFDFENVSKELPNFIRTVFLSGVSLKYWYMTSLLFGLLAVTPLWKKKVVWPGFVVGLLFYIFMMCCDSYMPEFRNMPFREYAFMYCQIFDGPQAGISSSIMFVSLGALICRYKPKYKWWMLAGGFVLLFAEVNLLHWQYEKIYGGTMYFSLILLAPALLMFALEHPGPKIDTSYFSDWCLLTYMIHHYLCFAFMGFGLNSILVFVLSTVCVLPITFYMAKKVDRSQKTLFSNRKKASVDSADHIN